MRRRGGKPVALLETRDAEDDGASLDALAPDSDRAFAADFETRRDRSLLERGDEVEADRLGVGEVEVLDNDRELRDVECRFRGTHVCAPLPVGSGDRQPGLTIETSAVEDFGLQTSVLAVDPLEAPDRQQIVTGDEGHQAVAAESSIVIARDAHPAAAATYGEAQRVVVSSKEKESVVLEMSVVEREGRSPVVRGVAVRNRVVHGAATKCAESDHRDSEQWNARHRADKIRTHRMGTPRHITLSALLSCALITAGGFGDTSLAQEIQPLGPVIEPDAAEGPVGREGGEEVGEVGEAGVIPLPEAGNRTAAAAADRVRVATVLPTSWSGIVASYQPHWTGVLSPTGFGIQRWSSYFSAAAISPVLTAHPFFGPWGVLAYDGWILDRYRDSWTSNRAPGRLAGAARYLQAADRAMAEGRVDDAVVAYSSVTQTAPDFALGYLALGAALAEQGRDDDAAAMAFRQSLDRYPGWLSLAVDLTLFYGRTERLDSVRAAADRRARLGSDSSVLVSGILHLFGDDPERGRTILSQLPDDLHAQHLISRGPR